MHDRPDPSERRVPSESVGDETVPSDGATRAPRLPEVDDRSRAAALGASLGPAPVPGPGTRFLPGSVIGDRYRIVMPLGRGGMGEVYRADDLRLGQPVALKFLPPELDRDPARLEMLANETRLARSVAHPNVCRVFDLAEHAGRHFVAMEFIDGEDLASLLRRVGRLPSERVTRLAAELAGAINAIHDAGIVHRDLKPANVMVDGRGRVRVTDFGIAAVDGAVRGDAGTPLYMSPEQLRGEPATVRSDLYAFGLILHELLVGTRPHIGTTMEQLRSERTDGSSTRLTSSRPDDIDPALERLMARCLESDPADRPASARHVAAALPGADPLAAALAAGETPSPELVAASMSRDGLSPRTVLALVALAVVSTIVAFVVFGRSPVTERAGAESPHVLRREAMRILESVGIERERFARQGYGLIAERAAPGDDASPSAPGSETAEAAAQLSARFWLRHSPLPLWSARSTAIFPAIILHHAENPPLDTPGMSTVILDGAARLISLRSIPARPETTEVDASPVGRRGPVGTTEWRALFRAAELDFDQATVVAPTRRPTMAVDELLAWSVASAGESGPEAHTVHGAVRDGQIAWFDAGRVGAGPDGDRSETMAALGSGWAGGVAVWIALAMMIAALYGCGLLALVNLRRGRADRHGAAVLSAFIGVGIGIGYTLVAASLGSDPRANLPLSIVSVGAYYGVTAWIMYIGLEPVARRFAPTLLTSWTRAVRGRLRDRRVAGDVLLGAAAAMAIWMIAAVMSALSGNQPLVNPPLSFGLALQPLVAELGYVIQSTAIAFRSTLVAIFILVLLARVLPGPRWIAILAYAVIAILLAAGGRGSDFPTSSEIWNVLFIIVSVGVPVLLLARVGALAFAISTFLIGLVYLLPQLSIDPTAWHVGPSLIVGGLLLALVAYALSCALDWPRLLAAPSRS